MYDEKGPVCRDPGVRRRLLPGGWPWDGDGEGELSPDSDPHLYAHGNPDAHTHAHVYPDLHAHPNPYSYPDRYPNTYTDADKDAACEAFAQAQAAANAQTRETKRLADVHRDQLRSDLLAEHVADRHRASDPDALQEG